MSESLAKLAADSAAQLEVLRDEHAKLLADSKSLKDSFAKRKNEWACEIFQLVELLGGDVRIRAGEHYSWPVAKRVFIDYFDYSREVQYRITDDASEAVPNDTQAFPETKQESA